MRSQHYPGGCVSLGSLGHEGEKFWHSANHNVLWGWKRDRGEQSRLVYYSGRLLRVEDEAQLQNHFFTYRHRMSKLEDANRIASELETAGAWLKDRGIRVSLSLRREAALPMIHFEFGEPRAEDLRLVRRLSLRRPRKRIAQACLPQPTPIATINKQLFPADLYLGSGVSYEAGLPTLCDMHGAFGVDSASGHDFAFGDEDDLPCRLAQDPDGTLRKFAAVHEASLRASITPAHEVIRRLVELGMVRKIFTDNVDNLISKLEVPFERTRGTGVLNERYPATFGSSTLIVVGVAADRRELISQARRKRMSIIVVNPARDVAPNVRHLTYVRPNDVFFHTTAFEFFTAVAEQLEDQCSDRTSAQCMELV